MTKTSLQAIIAASLLCLAQQAALAAAGPTEIKAQIESQGAARALAALTHTPGARPGLTQYDAVLDQVAQGNQPWLDVAAGLYPATDAGNRFALLNTVSLAIQNNPGGVMKFTDTVFRIDDICTNRLIEPTAGESSTFLEKTKAALRGVHSPALLARRNACLKLLS